ncbi:MAG TPA: EAL domain-containing protein [Thermoanaerobaculia bacterium]
MSAERYALAAKGSNDGLWDWNLTTGEIYFSERWKAMLGFEDHELPNAVDSWFGRVHPDDRPELEALLSLHLEGQTPHLEAEYRICDESGAYRWMIGRGMAVRHPDGRAYRIAGSQTDVSERKMAVAELIQNAFHDALTGLPNRLLFMDRLTSAANRAHRKPGSLFAVLFIDLDRFKSVNDTFGHAAGDAVLITIAQRLEASLRPGDTVARLGGDEFTILIEELADSADAVRIAERIGSETAAPMTFGEHEIATTASIGVAVNTNGADRAEDLLRDADMAMYRAKKLGKARYEVCDHDMHERAHEILSLERDLRYAIERDQLHVVYQPIVSIPTGKVAGFEALTRWDHPSRGAVDASVFIPMAERGGFVRAIGNWMRREAFLTVARWHSRFPNGGNPFLTVNVSGEELAQADFPIKLIEAVEESRIDPACIRLEVTETAIIRNLEGAANAMQLLASNKIRFAIDDFGTGYSSFTYLQRFPIDTLKIDRTFVSGMLESEESFRIVEMIVLLANVLKKASVAEGVETAEQLDALRTLGCGHAQGFLFSQGVSASRIEAALEDGNSWEHLVR